MKQLETRNPKLKIVHIPTPDYDGGLEAGYARAVKAVIESIVDGERTSGRGKTSKVLRPTPDVKSMNVIAGSHLTPGDVNELRELVEAFGMRAIILPDLSALDGSRQGFSPLATGGTAVQDIQIMGGSDFTIALGRSMEPAAKLLQQKFGIEYRVFDGIAGLADTDLLVLTLARISNRPVPARYERQRRALVDGMRDAQVYYGGKTACIALEPDLATQTSKWLDEMGAAVELAVIPTLSDAADHIRAREVQIGDLFSIRGEFDVLIANSHAESTAKRLGVPLYEMGFPVYKTLGYPSKVTIGYRGTLTMINEMANLLIKRHA
jgi:nitrogenase molybdenum-iron protein alpha/beta subunit